MAKVQYYIQLSEGEVPHKPRDDSIRLLSRLDRN